MNVLVLKSPGVLGKWYFCSLLESELTLTTDVVHAAQVSDEDLDGELCDANGSGFEFEPEVLPEAEPVVPVFLEGLVDILNRYHGEGATPGTLMVLQIELNSWVRQERLHVDDCLVLALGEDGFLDISFKEGTPEYVVGKIMSRFKDVARYVDYEFSFEGD